RFQELKSFFATDLRGLLGSGRGQAKACRLIRGCSSTTNLDEKPRAARSAGTRLSQIRVIRANPWQKKLFSRRCRSPTRYRAPSAQKRSRYSMALGSSDCRFWMRVPGLGWVDWNSGGDWPPLDALMRSHSGTDSRGS